MDETPKEKTSLREKAEDVAASGAGPDASHAKLGPEQLAHELYVHQIELEIQNLELQASQQALETSRRAFSELFLVAPVPYFVLSGSGVIRNLNLAAASLLSVPRGTLAGQSFYRHLCLESRERLRAGLESVSGEGGAQWEGELAVRTETGAVASWIHVRIARMEELDTTPSWLVVAFDVTATKKLVEDLRADKERLEEDLGALKSQLDKARPNTEKTGGR